MIRESKSPTLVREMLLAYLPEKHRDRGAGAGAGVSAAREDQDDHGRARKRQHGGGHGWFVTFADLMGLLVSFFVMLVAFSNQDQKKLQIVAGSMRDAFGVQTNVRYSGIIEVDGLPTRPKLKNAAHIRARGCLRHAHPRRTGPQARLRRQAQARPGLRARRGIAAPGAARHAGADRSVQAHHAGGDQGGAQYRDRRPGRPLDVSRKAPRTPIRARASLSRSSPDRSRRRPIGYRSPATPRRRARRRGRLRALEPVGRPRQRGAPNPGREGLPSNSIYQVAGKADTDPLFPDDPYIAANRRVTITLMREAPPVPPDMAP